MAGSPVSDIMDWPARFAAEHGRRPRILHLGNVVNNAYINATIQRTQGVDAYVLDPDLYHIMASPEWRDVEIDGDYGDDFYPDWSQTSAVDYRRPDWFAQGPILLAVAYLTALVQGRRREAARLRDSIDAFRRVNVPKRDISGAPPPLPKPRGLQAWGERRLAKLQRKLGRVVPAWSNPPERSVPGGDDSIPEQARFYRNSYWALRDLFEQFDVIQGYTVSAALALAVDMKRVVAYELGTIRGLPFEDTPAGRVAKWVYQTAPACIITNTDCVDAADRLGILPANRALALHPYDVNRAMAFASAPGPSPFTGDTPYFFAPARHHWKEGSLSFLKGNDVLIRAAGRLKRMGYAFRLLFVHWGPDVDLSKALIREEGLEENVIWTQPQSMLKLWRLCCGAVAVVDQFRAPALGGIAMDTMALGRRLITAYDAGMSTGFFDMPAPVCDARTEEDAARAMQCVLDDPQDLAGDGAKNQHWFATQHGIERQLVPQFEFYARLTRAFGIA